MTIDAQLIQIYSTFATLRDFVHKRRIVKMMEGLKHDDVIGRLTWIMS